MLHAEIHQTYDYGHVNSMQIQKLRKLCFTRCSIIPECAVLRDRDCNIICFTIYDIEFLEIFHQKKVAYFENTSINQYV